MMTFSSALTETADRIGLLFADEKLAAARFNLQEADRVKHRSASPVRGLKQT
jgi:hypothetical protein